jgi:hypothetical protein
VVVPQSGSRLVQSFVVTSPESGTTVTLNQFMWKVLRKDTSVEDVYRTGWFQPSSHVQHRKSCLCISGERQIWCDPNSSSARALPTSYTMDLAVGFDAASAMTTLVIVETTMSLFQSIVALISAPQRVVVIARRAQFAHSSEHIGLCAMARTVRREESAAVPILYLETTGKSPDTDHTEPEVLVNNKVHFFPRLMRHRAKFTGYGHVTHSTSAHMVTGGTGGLGLITARWIAAK